MYIYIYMYICIYVYIYIYKYLYMYIYVCKIICYTYTCIHIYICIFIPIYTYTDICIYVSIMHLWSSMWYGAVGRWSCGAVTHGSPTWGKSKFDTSIDILLLPAFRALLGSNTYFSCWEQAFWTPWIPSPRPFSAKKPYKNRTIRWKGPCNIRGPDPCCLVFSRNADSSRWCRMLSAHTCAYRASIHSRAHMHTHTRTPTFATPITHTCNTHLHMCKNEHNHKEIYTYTYTTPQIRTHAHTHTHKHMHTHTHTQTHKHEHTLTRIYRHSKVQKVRKSRIWRAEDLLIIYRKIHFHTYAGCIHARKEDNTWKNRRVHGSMDVKTYATHSRLCFYFLFC